MNSQRNKETKIFINQEENNMKMNRVNELVASMKSFGKEKYYRDD